MEPRKRPTARQRSYALARFGYCCALKLSPHCVGDLEGKPFDWDHALPLGLGGDNEDDQWQPCCRPCHKAKTRKDVGMIRKADRQGGKKGSQWARREKRGSTLKGQGFNAWRGMNGVVRYKKRKEND